jgi:hypothetical protein
MGKTDRVQYTINRYNEIVESGQLNLVDVNLGELPASTQKYVKVWLGSFGIPFKLHKPVINHTYLFVVDDNLARYLMHDSLKGSHMWGDKNFDNLDNNTVLAHFAGTKGGNEKAIRQLFNSVDSALSHLDN